MPHPSWDDYQASWNTLLQQMSEVYIQDISDKRPEWTQFVVQRTIERLSAILSEVTYVINSTLATLRREQNRSATVHSLPEEILIRIFEMSSHYSAPRSSSVDVDVAPEPLPRNLLAISHTCAQWHTMCRRCPRLWAIFHVDHMSKDLVRLFFKRSREYPLDLNFEYREPPQASGHGSESTDEDSADVRVDRRQLSHEKRFRWLWTELSARVRRFRYGRSDKFGSVELLTDTPHARLECLEALELLNEGRAVTAELPNLRRLDVRVTPSATTADSLTKLTHLTLSNVGRPLQLQVIIKILCASPVLQSIELASSVNFMETSTSELDVAELPVVHQRVATVILDLPAQSAHIFLRCVTLPNVSQLDLRFGTLQECFFIEELRGVPEDVPWLSAPWADSSFAEVVVERRLGRGNQITHVMEIQHKRWAAADPRRALLVNVSAVAHWTIQTSFNREVSKALREVVDGLLPKLRGPQAALVPHSSFPRGAQAGSPLGATGDAPVDVPVGAATLDAVRLGHYFNRSYLDELTSALASLDIPRLEIASTIFWYDDLQALVKIDEVLSNLQGRTLAFVKCHVKERADLWLAANAFVSSGARVVFEDCRMRTDDEGWVLFNWCLPDENIPQFVEGSSQHLV